MRALAPVSFSLAISVLFLASPPISAQEAAPLRTVPELEGASFKAVPWRAEILSAVPEEPLLTDPDGNVIPFTGAGFDGRFVYMPSLLPGEYSLAVGREVANFTVTLGGGENAPMSSPVGDINRLGGPGPSYALALVAAGAAAGLFLFVRQRRRSALLSVLLTLAAASVVEAYGFGVDEPMRLDECMKVFRDDITRQNECARERSTFTLPNEGARPAVLELVAARPEGCHDLAHELGRRAWLFAGEEGALPRNLDACYNGYYHGVLYGAATYMSDESFMAMAKDLCPRLLDAGHEQMASCTHGIGHATLVRLGGDFTRAEQICFEMTPSEENYVLECRGGAMFAHVHAAYAGQRLGAGSPSPGVEPLELCRNAGDLAAWCYQGVATSIGLPFGSGEALLRLCVDEAPSPKLRIECIRGMAVEFRNVHSHEPEGASACLLLDSQEEQDVCGLFAGYSYYLLQEDASVAARACDAAEVTPSRCAAILDSL